MVAKSGGKPIVTTEQFEMEVLGVGSGIVSSVGRIDLSDDGEPNINDESSPTAATTTSLQPSQQQQPQLPILVFFAAPWCQPCRLTVPIVREIQNLYPPNRLAVYEISTDDLPEVAELAGVSSIPTIVLYYGGEVQDTIVGCVNVKVLSRAVEKVLEDVGMI
jgi:thioredoxin 1